MELKKRLLWTVIIFVAVFILTFIKIKDIFEILLDKGVEIGYSLISLSPQEVITQEFRLAAVLALFITFPVALYQIWAYVMQPEKTRDKLKTTTGIVLIMALFLLGAIFAFKLIIPFMLDFLLKISNELKVVDKTISVEKYVSFYISTLTVFGVIMEMPAITVVLSRVGLITPKVLRKIRPFAVVVIFIVGAIVTPPDVTSQLMVAIPMIAVYELCILVSKIFGQKTKEDESYEKQN